MCTLLNIRVRFRNKGPFKIYLESTHGHLITGNDPQVTVYFEKTWHLSKSIHTVDLYMTFIKIKYKLKSFYNFLT